MAASNALPFTGLGLNEETYPFRAVEQELDKAALFNLSASAGRSQPARVLEGGRTFVLREQLRRFVIAMEEPSHDSFRSYAAAGEVLAESEQDWTIVADGETGRPGAKPVNTQAFDPGRRQRFLISRAVFRFGANHGFHGFGAGSTVPSLAERPGATGVGAVGTILEGFGAFAGSVGTYTCCGSLSAEDGFTGNVLLRVMDPSGALRAHLAVPPFRPVLQPEPGISYLFFRGQKRDRNQRSGTLLDPSGKPAGLDVSQQLRLFDIDAAMAGGTPSARARQRQVAGSMNAKIRFNLLQPGAPGSDEAPIPFTSYNRYEFTSRGGQCVGSLEADSTEGRTFLLKLAGLPRQAALRFGGFGPILNGTGVLEGARGLMADNSVVGLSPHALATTYVIRLIDPAGRFRADRSRLWW